MWCFETDWLAYEANRRKRLVNGNLAHDSKLAKAIIATDIPDDRKQELLASIDDYDRSNEEAYQSLCRQRKLVAAFINQQKITNHNDKVRFIYCSLRHLEGKKPGDPNETISPQQMKFLVSGV